jgi:hypothetical protein
LIARTGTVIPGVGTVFALASVQIVVPPASIDTTTSGAINNDAGQVLFCATIDQPQRRVAFGHADGSRRRLNPPRRPSNRAFGPKTRVVMTKAKKEDNHED